MAVLEEVFERDEEGSALGRHALMLGSLVLLIVGLPFSNWLPGHGMRFPFLLGLVLVSAIYMNRAQTWIRWSAISIGGFAFVGLFVAHTTGSAPIRIGSELLGLVLLGSTTLVLLNTLVKTEKVMLDTVIGGVCVYLLIGLCFGLVYRLIIDMNPGAFRMGDAPLATTFDDASTLAVRLLYFSFVTLTTVGFGDIRPDSELAQMVAIIEAVLGQLYIAIFIARLMALYVMRGPAAKSG